MPISPPPLLDVYYAPSCAPCRLDLPVLAELVTRNGVAVRIIVVSEAAKAMADLTAASPALAKTAQIAPAQDTRALLRQAGDSDGILPYARTHAGGKVCATWRGRLSLPKALQMLAACRQRPISPPLR